LTLEGKPLGIKLVLYIRRWEDYYFRVLPLIMQKKQHLFIIS